MQPDDPITSDGINGRRPAERALVYLAGPLMNMILTIFVLCLSGFLLGDTDETKVLVGQVDKKKPAALMGLKVGDEVLEVNGKPVTGAETVLDAIHPNVGKSITLKVRRRDQELSLTGAAEARTIEGDFLVVTQAPASSGLPVQAGDQLDKVDGKRVETLAGKGEAPDAAVERVLREKAGQPVTLTVWREGKTRLELRGPAAPLEVSAQAGKRTIGALGFGPLPGQGPPLSLEKSVSNGIERLGTLSQGLLSMFSRPKQLSQNLGGVISIYALLGGAVNLPPMYYLSIIAQLSLSLAVFNLLPIFLLDGGHLLILTIEVLRRKRLDPEMHKRAAMVGMAIIGVLFVWIMTKDILRHWL